MSRTITVKFTEPQMDALLGALSCGIDQWEAEIEDHGLPWGRELSCANRAFDKLSAAWHRER